MGQWSGFKTFENFMKVPYKVKSDYFELLAVYCLKPINADWFDAKFYKTECDITIHLLIFYSVLTHFQKNKRNERLRNNFWAIARLFYFIHYLQNGEKFAFKTKFLEALRQFKSAMCQMCAKIRSPRKWLTHTTFS